MKTYKDIKIGQEFSIVKHNKYGQVVHTVGNYTKISENEVRCSKDTQIWTLKECGLNQDTIINGTIWG